MKVIIVAPHFHPRIGGVETYTLNIATRLVTLGWQVVIVTSDSGVLTRGGSADPGGRPPGPPGAGAPSGAAFPPRTNRSSVQAAPRPGGGPEMIAGLPVYRLPVAMTVSNTPVGVGWRRQLARIFAAERPDVINGHTPVPYLADLAERASGPVPFVLTYHNDLAKDALLAKVAVTALQRTLVARTLRRAQRIIATSDYYLRQSPYLRGHEDKISVVPPGVDLATFNPEVQVSDELAARYAGDRVILFVGSLNKSQQYKGLDVLIRAFGSIAAVSPDVRLVVAGEGDGLDMYRGSAVAAGVADRVDFAGHVGHDRLAQYYKLATVFAMPSTSRTEGFGTVYLEAGAVGTPVIGTRIGGVPSSVKDGQTGLLVSPNNARELERALTLVLDDTTLARRLGDAGAARARAEFDWQSLAVRTSEVLAATSGRAAALGGEYAHDPRLVS